MEIQDFFTQYAIPASQLLIIIAAALILLFGLLSTIFNLVYSPKETIKGLIGAILLVGLVFAMWTVSSGEIDGIFKTAKYSHVTENVMKIVTTGVWTSGVLIVGALAVTVLTEFVNLFR